MLVVSCGERQERRSRAVTGDRERVEVTERTRGELEEYPIPTSMEVVDLLQRAGAPYILGISNPVENADRYFTERRKALNLGVYGAALSYATTYEMNQETMKYLEVCKRLVDELNISTSFNMSFVERVERNLDDKDSLINIVTDSFYDTYVFLNQRQRDDLSLLVLTGTWIEGTFLTSQIAITARDNREITEIIIQQKEPLENLLALLKDREDDSSIDNYYKELTEIYEFLITLQSPMSAQALDTFASMIERIRTTVIA